MKKKIKLLLLAVSSLFSANMMAENGDAIILTQASGEVVGFSFDQEPKLSFSATDIVITTGETSVNYPMEGLKITFGQLPTSTAIQETQTAKTQFSIAGANVNATGLNAGQVVNVFSVNGTKVATVKADAEGNATVSLPSKGAYIVNTGKITYKIATK